jgi:hypothetical protein
MAKKPSFNFGANAKPKRNKTVKKMPKGNKGGGKSNAWRAYAGVSNAPIPD